MNSAQQLATKVSSIDEAEIRAIRAKIEYLDGIEPRFSSRTLELFEQMGEDVIFAVPSIRKTLTKSIGSSGVRISSTRRVPHQEFAHHVIKDVILFYSVFTVDRVEQSDYKSIAAPWCKDADLRINAIRPELRPDIFDDKFVDIKSYYQSLAAAAIILECGDLNERFNKEVPAFISWASKQDDLESALTCALKMKSLRSEHVEAILAQQKETVKPLHDGLI